MLAGMYDSSLDQFKPHSWSFSPFQIQRYHSFINNSARESFKTQDFNTHNIYSGYGSFHRQYYDALDWFGFSLRGDRYTNRQYLNRITAVTYFSSTRSSTNKLRKPDLFTALSPIIVATQFQV